MINFWSHLLHFMIFKIFKSLFQDFKVTDLLMFVFIYKIVMLT